MSLRTALKPSWMLTCLLVLGVVMQPYMLVQAETADRDQPIELEADTVTVDEAKKISIYTGNVILTQGSLVIRAEKMTVREDGDGFQHSICYGSPTTFKQKRTGKDEYIEGGGQRIEYNGRMDKVKLFTSAWVKRGEDIINGDFISYDANAEFAEVIGGTKANPNGMANGRVKAVIQPKNKTAPAPVAKPTPPGLKMNRNLQTKPVDSDN